MDIEYKVNSNLTLEQFMAVLEKSELSQRRPVEDEKCIEGMLLNSNLVVSAWIDGEVVGVARSITDFHYACYLSDLAVSKEYQQGGIGKQLQIKTQEQLGPKCKLILIAAPAANAYYQRLGYTNNPRCWVLEPDKKLQMR